MCGWTIFRDMTLCKIPPQVERTVYKSLSKQWVGRGRAVWGLGQLKRAKLTSDQNQNRGRKHIIPLDNNSKLL